jgi:hypothetical protein
MAESDCTRSESRYLPKLHLSPDCSTAITELCQYIHSYRIGRAVPVIRHILTDCMECEPAQGSSQDYEGHTRKNRTSFSGFDGEV